MKSFLAMIIAALCICQGLAVAPQPRVSSSVAAKVQQSTTSLNVFGNKKSAAQKAEEEAKAAKYWQGEWVCKDCGYIYNRGRFLSLAAFSRSSTTPALTKIEDMKIHHAQTI